MKLRMNNQSHAFCPSLDDAVRCFFLPKRDNAFLNIIHDAARKPGLTLLEGIPVLKEKVDAVYIQPAQVANPVQIDIYIATAICGKMGLLLNDCNVVLVGIELPTVNL